MKKFFNSDIGLFILYVCLFEINVWSWGREPGLLFRTIIYTLGWYIVYKYFIKSEKTEDVE